MCLSVKRITEISENYLREVGIKLPQLSKFAKKCFRRAPLSSPNGNAIGAVDTSTDVDETTPRIGGSFGKAVNHEDHDNNVYGTPTAGYSTVSHTSIRTMPMIAPPSPPPPLLPPPPPPLRIAAADTGQDVQRNHQQNCGGRNEQQ